MKQKILTFGLSSLFPLEQNLGSKCLLVCKSIQMSTDKIVSFFFNGWLFLVLEHTQACLGQSER